MLIGRKKKATYRVAAAIARDELHAAKGAQAVTREQFERDELFGCVIPGVYRESRSPAHGQAIGHGWEPGVEGEGVDLTGYVVDGKGF